MADRFGRRRVFELGLVLFTLGSLLCSAAPSEGWLVVFRMLQAIGGSMLNPVAMSIIRNVFTDARERAQAIGVWGATVGISLALGPVVGGALVESVGWRSIFWINVPVGLLALALTMRFVPESRAPRPRRLDPVGELLVIALLASLTYAIIEAPSAGWTSDQSIGLFAFAAAALVALVVYESPAHRAAAGTALLSQRPLLQRERDRGLLLRRPRRVPVPQHPLPAGDPRPVGARRPGCTRSRSPP